MKVRPASEPLMNRYLLTQPLPAAVSASLHDFSKVLYSPFAQAYLCLALVM